jgi:hypothetical protein
MPTTFPTWVKLFEDLIQALGWWGALIALAVIAAAVGARYFFRRHARQTVILLRETYIHLIQNGPVTHPPAAQANRVGENIAWWEGEVLKVLKRSGASDGKISKFKALGNMNRGSLIADKLDALEEIIQGWEKKKP